MAPRLGPKWSVRCPQAELVARNSPSRSIGTSVPGISCCCSKWENRVMSSIDGRITDHDDLELAGLYATEQPETRIVSIDGFGPGLPTIEFAAFPQA